VGGRAGAGDDRATARGGSEEHQESRGCGQTEKNDRVSEGCPVEEGTMIRKLKSGEYRLYSRKKDPKSGKRRNLGTFKSLAAAQKHERAVQFFKRH
jgi:hypothetical protein